MKTRYVLTLCTAAASSAQSAGIADVNQSIGNLDQMTQQNAALVEQSAAAAESLRDQSAQLAQAVAVFKVAPDLATAFGVAQSLRCRAVVGCGATELCRVLEMLGRRVRHGRPAGVGGLGCAPTITALLGANAGVRIEACGMLAGGRLCLARRRLVGGSAHVVGLRARRPRRAGREEERR